MTSRNGLLGKAGHGIVPLVVLGCTLAGCDRKAPAAFERPPAAVTVATTEVKDVPVYVDEIGKIVAREVVSIQPQVSGRITEIHFVDGADVRKGDLLFTIDPRPYQARLDQATASLARARAVLDLAKTELGRVAKLAGTKAVSQSDFDTRKNAVAVADAQARLDQASVDTAVLDLEYCSIRSPIDGRAGQRLVDVGNVVAANGAPLLVVERVDPIYADFTVSENDLIAVQQAMAQGALRADVSLPDLPGEPVSGALTFLDNAVQDQSGTVKLRATVPNPERRFWPGRFVKVRLVLRTRPNAVLVPVTAPQPSAKGDFVAVVKADSTAELRPVKVGQRQGDSVVIEEGLAAGERVVVTGQLAVTPGGKVRIEEPAAGAAAPSAAPAKGV
jgi:multidrug efflux system membrane fusion protein